MSIDICQNLLLSLERDTAPATYNAFDAHSIREQLPCERALTDNWDAFRSLSQIDWSTLRSGMTIEIAARLMIYSMRMAAFSIRKTGAETLSSAAMGVIVDDDIVDFRFVLMVCACVHDASLRLKTPSDDALRDVLKYASVSRASVIEGFLSRNDYLKSLGALGLEAVDRPEFAYRMVL